MPKKLKNMIIDRVDLVKKGSNPDSHVTLFKRHADDEQADVDVHLSGNSMDLEVVRKIVQEQLDEMQKGGNEPMTFEEILKALPEDQQKVIMDKVDVQDDGGEAFDKEELPESVRTRLELLEKQAKDAQDMAKVERERRLDGEFAKKATVYASVAEVDKVAVALRKSFAVDEELGKLLEDVLKQASERIAKGNLFKAEGQDGGDDGASNEPFDKLTKVAKDLCNSDADLSFEKAFEQAVVNNPDLYDEYINQ